MFFIRNLLTTIYSKTIICDLLRLGKFCCYQSTRACFKSTAYIKIILKSR